MIIAAFAISVPGAIPGLTKNKRNITLPHKKADGKPSALKYAYDLR